MKAFILLVTAAMLAAGRPATAQIDMETIEVPDKVLELIVGDAFKINFHTPNLPDQMGTVSTSVPDVAEIQTVSTQGVIIYARKPGRTSVFIANTVGETLWSGVIEVAVDVERIKQGLKEEFPGLEVAVKSGANGRVIVSGTVPDAVTATDVIGLVDTFLIQDPSQATGGEGQEGGAGSQEQAGSAGQGEGIMGERFSQIVNRLVVTGGRQVSIKVRIAEVSRTIRERLGLRWQNLTFRVDSTEFGFAESPIFGEPPETLTTGLDLAGLIDVLAEENFASVLAQPNLTVASGETAGFLSGGEIPFVTVSREGTPSVQFKPFGVLLDVTPTVLSENRIVLRVRPEVSEPDYSRGAQAQNVEYPSFIVRRADTTVELASGQSFALAGLLDARLTDAVAKFPFLGDIPIIGALARSSRFQRGDTELVIIVTASIARPTNEPLSVPNETIELRGPIARLFIGRTYVPKNVLPQDFIY